MTQARFIFALSKAEGSRIGLYPKGLALNEEGEEVFLFASSTQNEAEANSNQGSSRNLNSDKAREFIQILGRRFGTYTDNLSDPR